ncbi:MAG: hypothetical protein ABJG41_03730 [Cyclobacteriaceae bacterium]
MRNNLYYGEIAAKISAHLYQNPEQVSQIDETYGTRVSEEDTLYTVCADAARAFDAIETLTEDPYIAWHDALDEYADDVLDHLMTGDTLDIIDMVSMASKSVQSIR